MGETACYPGRLEVRRHLDSSGGFLDAAAVRAFVGRDGRGEAYVCGLDAFMEMVENALPEPGVVYSERFGTPVPAPPVSADPIAWGAAGVSPEIGPSSTDTSVSATTPSATAAPPPSGETGTVTILLNRKKKTVPRRTIRLLECWWFRLR